MKNYNGFMAIIALFVMNGAVAMLPQGVSPQTNYGRFLLGFSRPVITQNNMVDMDWVKGAVMAMAEDRITGNNVDNLAVATMLWRAIEGTIDYYANLPQNRSNSDFRNRIWQSLTRSVDQVRRLQQPRVQPQMMQPQVQPDLVSAGLQALNNFKMQSAQIIQTNPAYFYSAGSVQASWLREALRAMTSNGQMAINAGNRANVQDEILRAADMLIRQILEKDPRRLSVAQKNAIAGMVRVQVEKFMQGEPAQLRSRM
jgi:hypothetical protein